MEVKQDYDYAAEYAKSNRSQCKGCKSLIAKDSLRIALMVQSPFYDGRQPNWYHYSCFFGKCRPTNTEEIKNFNSLRFPDQEKIQAQIDGFASGAKTSKKGPKIISKTLKDFVVQYATSSRSTCRGCDNKIEKDEIRLSHKEKHPEKPQLGLVDRWHHVGCFLKKKDDMGWQQHFTAEMLTGFNGLDAEDKASIRKLLAPKEKRSKSKTDASAASSASAPDPAKEELKKKMKSQSILMWKNIDKLKKLDMRKDELIRLLEYNKQRVPTGIDAIYLAIGDGMTFGALPLCPECKGNLVVGSHDYHCTGQISEWTSCSYSTTEIVRNQWSFPKYAKEMDDFFSKYKYKKLDRVFPPRAAPLPLKQKKVLLIGKLSTSKSDIKALLEKLGGGVTTTLGKAYFCISTKQEVQAMGKKISDARVQDVFVVSEEIITALESQTSPQPLITFLKKYSIAEWGTEQTDRGGGKRALEEEKYETNAKKIKMVVKSGAAVDPKSGLEDRTHVMVKGDLKYTATLAMVDMKHGSNSYYKLQLLESDSGKRFYVFRSWGRVGTSIGGTKLDNFYSAENAIINFRELYLEKTGNNFGTKNFQKFPRKFYPLEIDYGEDDEKLKSLQSAGNNSKLHDEVQKIIKMIFDIEKMKRAMVEFEIDLNKMPLGKLSKRQMQTAYSVLQEASELIDRGELTGPKILDCSNRFYTLIPHDFGMKQPPMLDNLDLIKSKVEMIDNLLDIEVAYNLLQGDKDVKKEDEEVDPLDVQYQKLQCEIKPLEKDHDMHKTIVKMVKNTHAKTHSGYSLEVEQVFEVDRKGERTRFKPFKSLPNRRLLWHGSRVTNYAGILSQGLRIAPPEAPVTGYMFGKGIYFADMVSKSANYCNCSHSNPTGLLLLAEVALGNMYELKDAMNVMKLPKGKHSVKGVGSTSPDSNHDLILEDGTVAHSGTGVDTNIDRSSLLYNEYIVYDTAQVNLKYLVKTKFNMQSRW
ncbi:poly [ADP-ribose] polymerase 1-like [Styela clava]